MADWFAGFTESLKQAGQQTLQTAQTAATQAAVASAQQAVDRGFTAVGLQKAAPQVAPMVGDIGGRTVNNPPAPGSNVSPKADDATALKQERVAVTGADLKTWAPWIAAGLAGVVIVALLLRRK